ncbi:hypothetical protein [Paenibacillus hexagrammi]|nr:hypothetical protein [Paenibacillus sp. YPD9-1]
MAAMLILVVIMIYNSTLGGSSGTRQQVKDSGGRLNTVIERIDP